MLKMPLTPRSKANRYENAVSKPGRSFIDFVMFLASTPKLLEGVGSAAAAQVGVAGPAGPVAAYAAEFKHRKTIAAIAAIATVLRKILLFWPAAFIFTPRSALLFVPGDTLLLLPVWSQMLIFMLI